VRLIFVHFFALITMNVPSAGIATTRLNLRPATEEDAPALQQYYVANRVELEPWEPLRNDSFYTLEATQQRLADMTRQMAVGNALHLYLCQPDTGAMLGQCSFTNIVRGAFQACHLGFSIDRCSQGQGLMHEALTSAINFVFTHGRLHRIMANYRPENQRSGHLLRRLGFEQEGRARAYLKINGAWADHILTSRINDALN
jgi:ribosomal-protein-alanine N-acetyltransferase